VSFDNHLRRFCSSCQWCLELRKWGRGSEFKITNKGDYGRSNFSVAPKFPQNEIFSTKFCIFGRKGFPRGSPHGTPPHQHHAVLCCASLEVMVYSVQWRIQGRLGEALPYRLDAFYNQVRILHKIRHNFFLFLGSWL